MAAEFTARLVRPHHHGERIPSNQRSDTPLDRRVAGTAGLMCCRNSIEVGGRRSEGDMGTAATRLVDQGLKKKMRPLLTFPLDDCTKRVLPLLGF